MGVQEPYMASENRNADKICAGEVAVDGSQDTGDDCMVPYKTDFLLGLYRQMLRIRLFEESLVDPILKGEIKTPCHLCTGQEAVAVGVCSALKEGDQIFGNHRSHGHYLAMGGDMNRLAAEIYGKETGCSRGRGGSMHIIDAEKGVMGCVPIVAGTISLAVGTALAKKMKNDGGVIVSFFGDGACGEGVLYESLNFAVLHSLPIIFACENNQYATHMPVFQCISSPLAPRMLPFKVYTGFLNGNDVLKIYEHTKTAKEEFLPAFIEYKTYRLRGHVGPDDNIQGQHGDIRPKEEIEEWRKRDPIETFKDMLIEPKCIEPAILNRIELDSRAEVQKAHEFARSSPWPKGKELERYVYA